MGPVGVLCVQRTLNKGRSYGFVTGVGAAISDIIYALLTGFGMSFVMDLITDHQNKFYLQIFGKYEEDYKRACYQFIAERNRFEKLLREIPYLRVIPSQANYFCMEVTSRFTSAELTERLLADYEIMVKDCNSKNYLQGRNYIRVSVRDTEDNNQLIRALKELAE